MKKYYDILGIGIDSTAREIKKSARRLFMQYHPDLNPRNRAACEEKTKSITAAYNILLKSKQSEEKELAARSVREDWEKKKAVEAELEILAFTLAHRNLAVETKNVRGVLRLKDIRIENFSAVSEVAPFLAGLFYHGAEVGILWNIHDQLHLKAAPIGSGILKSKILVVEIEGSPVGFMVDAVAGISTIKTNSVAAPPAEWEISPGFLFGVAQVNGEETGLLDLSKMMYID